jgi:hypothetical protein
MGRRKFWRYAPQSRVHARMATVVYEKGQLVFIPDHVQGYVSGVVDSLKIGGGAGGSIILEERVMSKAERLAGNLTALSPVTKCEKTTTYNATN